MKGGWKGGCWMGVEEGDGSCGGRLVMEGGWRDGGW